MQHAESIERVRRIEARSDCSNKINAPSQESKVEMNKINLYFLCFTPNRVRREQDNAPQKRQWGRYRWRSCQPPTRSRSSSTLPS